MHHVWVFAGRKSVACELSFKVHPSEGTCRQILEKAKFDGWKMGKSRVSYQLSSNSCTLATKHCCYKALLLQSTVATKHCCHKALLPQSTVATKHCCYKALLLQCTIATKHCCHKALLLQSTVCTSSTCCVGLPALLPRGDAAWNDSRHAHEGHSNSEGVSRLQNTKEVWLELTTEIYQG